MDDVFLLTFDEYVDSVTRAAIQLVCRHWRELVLVISRRSAQLCVFHHCSADHPLYQYVIDPERLQRVHIMSCVPLRGSLRVPVAMQHPTSATSGSATLFDSDMGGVNIGRSISTSSSNTSSNSRSASQCRQRSSVEMTRTMSISSDTSDFEDGGSHSVRGRLPSSASSHQYRPQQQYTPRLSYQYHEPPVSLSPVQYFTRSALEFLARHCSSISRIGITLGAHVANDGPPSSVLVEPSTLQCQQDIMTLLDSIMGSFGLRLSQLSFESHYTLTMNPFDQIRIMNWTAEQQSLRRLDIVLHRPPRTLTLRRRGSTPSASPTLSHSSAASTPTTTTTPMPRQRTQRAGAGARTAASEPSWTVGTDSESESGGPSSDPVPYLSLEVPQRVNTVGGPNRVALMVGRSLSTPSLVHAPALTSFPPPLSTVEWRPIIPTLRYLTIKSTQCSSSQLLSILDETPNLTHLVYEVAAMQSVSSSILVSAIQSTRCVHSLQSISLQGSPPSSYNDMKEFDAARFASLRTLRLLWKLPIAAEPIGLNRRPINASLFVSTRTPPLPEPLNAGSPSPSTSSTSASVSASSTTSGPFLAPIEYLLDSGSPLETLTLLELNCSWSAYGGYSNGSSAMLSSIPLERLNEIHSSMGTAFIRIPQCCPMLQHLAITAASFIDDSVFAQFAKSAARVSKWPLQNLQLSGLTPEYLTNIYNTNTEMGNTTKSSTLTFHSLTSRRRIDWNASFPAIRSISLRDMVVFGRNFAKYDTHHHHHHNQNDYYQQLHQDQQYQLQRIGGDSQLSSAAVGPQIWRVDNRVNDIGLRTAHWISSMPHFTELTIRAGYADRPFDEHTLTSFWEMLCHSVRVHVPHVKLRRAEKI
ncbi:hypothetical protein GQ42DRAFT_162177 [Ramicandelaber brevisporus]|nr:hypothetical protein GQ42DRAFT_162177 [Ramicandelaber brevisporus]